MYRVRMKNFFCSMCYFCKKFGKDDYIRVHSTSFAPRSFMYDLEKRCHAVFERNRVRSEYFAITFEEAVAELDSHAEEIADALKKADEKTIEEIK